MGIDRILVIESLLGYDDEFLRKCLLILYNKQEEDEQSMDESIYQNGVGFNKADARILGDFALQLIETGELKVNDGMRRRITKYSKQLSNYLTNEEIGI